MEVLSVVGKVAEVAQLPLPVPGVDVSGLIKMIVQAAETVQQNKKECRVLAHRISLIGDLLQKLLDDPESELMKESATRKPLEELENTLRDAYTLVVGCQEESNVVCLMFKASRTAGELREVQDQIHFHLNQLVPLINLVHTTILLGKRPPSQVAPEVPTHHPSIGAKYSDYQASDSYGEIGKVPPATANEPWTTSPEQEPCSFIRPPDGPIVVADEPVPGYFVGRPVNGPTPAAAAPAPAAQVPGYYMGLPVVANTAAKRHDDLVSANAYDLADKAGLLNFNLSELADATNDFSSSNQIAKGGFGIVYKGRLLDGIKVAMERFSSQSEDLKYFEDELKIVSQLDENINITKYMGYCTEIDNRILVYEYMTVGSLGDILFGESTEVSLDWPLRLKIAEGIGKGVAHLHQYKPCIIHRDLKPDNILLDFDMNPKIVDFGVAKILYRGVDEKCVNVVGTFGYIAPEYMLDGAVSTKIDVYSFGVMFLEIISGKRFKRTSTAADYNVMITSAWVSWRSGKFAEFIDPLIQNGGESNNEFGKEMKKYMQIALLCIQEKPTDRPAMSGVHKMLKSKNAGWSRLPSPKQPNYIRERGAAH